MAATLPPPAAPAGELDELTLRRAQRGEAAACRALVERYQAPVFALLGRMLGRARGRTAVEDLAQDTFLQAFRALPDFRADGAARLSTWILTIAARRAVDELRRPVRGGDALPERLVDPRATRGDAAVHRAELGRAIERALAGLSPDHRAAFLLREYHGLDYAELAAALAVDVGTVKSRLSRARAALREALAEVAP